MQSEQNVIGVIPLQENREIHFFIAPFRGKPILHIREFIKSVTYTGYTKKGVTFQVNSLESLVHLIDEISLPFSIENRELEVGRIPKNKLTEVVVRIIKIKSNSFLDIREFLKSETYEGWTKKGVCIPLKYFEDVKIFIKSCHDILSKDEDIFKQYNKVKDTSFISDEDIAEILGKELLNFPADFVEFSNSEEFLKIELPKEPLKFGVYREGIQYILSDDGFVLELKNQVEGKYVIYSQMRGNYSVKLPKNMFITFKAVKNYEKYSREIKTKLIENYKKKYDNYLLAKNKTKFLLEKLGVPWIE